jgi:D-alanyl-D-alanine carboxypeptidase
MLVSPKLLALPLIVALSSAASGQSVDQLMNNVLPRPHNTNFSVVILRDGEAHFRQRGVADSNSRYMLASVSKQFTAAAILALEDENKLKLSDRASKFFGNLPTWNRITVRSLLNHQTSLPDYVSAAPYRNGAPFQSGIPLNSLITQIASNAGTPVQRNCLQYSNSNYAVLAGIVEAASGQSFGSYLSAKIFKPLAMHATGYTAAVLSGVQPGHFQNGQPTPSYHSSWANGAGGIVTSGADMAKWNRALLDGFLDIVDRVRSDVVTGACSAYGIPRSYAYGWIVKPDGTMEHSGSVEGYSAYNTINPDQNSAVTVLSNFAGYASGMAAFASQLENASIEEVEVGPNYCCTALGKFGPGPNPSGLPGQSCFWRLPGGITTGQTCQ